MPAIESRARRRDAVTTAPRCPRCAARVIHEWATIAQGGDRVLVCIACGWEGWNALPLAAAREERERKPPRSRGEPI